MENQPAADLISVAAEALLQIAQQMVAAGKGDGSLLDKGKKSVKCFRCGFSGHVLADCPTLLCDYCEGTGHVDDDCHLLKMLKPHVEIYGQAHDDLTFYAMPLTDTNRPKTENTRTGKVPVEGGEMTVPQITRQLQRSVPWISFNGS